MRSAIYCYTHDVSSPISLCLRLDTYTVIALGVRHIELVYGIIDSLFVTIL